MKFIKLFSIFIVTIILVEKCFSRIILPSSNELIKYRYKRQAGMMPVLFLVAAAKAVFSKAYIAGSIARGGMYGGGRRTEVGTPGE